jgi:hypothetical protein
MLEQVRDGMVGIVWTRRLRRRDAQTRNRAAVPAPQHQNTVLALQDYTENT